MSVRAVNSRAQNQAIALLFLKACSHWAFGQVLSLIQQVTHCNSERAYKQITQGQAMAIPQMSLNTPKFSMPKKALPKYSSPGKCIPVAQVVDLRTSPHSLYIPRSRCCCAGGHHKALGGCKELAGERHRTSARRSAAVARRSAAARLASRTLCVVRSKGPVGHQWSFSGSSPAKVSAISPQASGAYL